MNGNTTVKELLESGFETMRNGGTDTVSATVTLPEGIVKLDIVLVGVLNVPPAADPT